MEDNNDYIGKAELEEDIDKSISVEAEKGKNFVEITFPCVAIDNIVVPCVKSDYVAKFLFKSKSVEDEKEIEKRSYIISQRPDKIDNSTICYPLYRRLTLRKCLFSIGDWFIERQNGWITEKDWDRVKNMSAPIINTALSLFDILTSLRAEEEALIERQATGLFASQNGGVLNPHPVLASYCSTATMWEKVGLGVNDMDKVLNKDYLGFRMITGAESDAMRRSMAKK
jgi:hypothetical protein